MIAKFKALINPETQKQIYERIILVLMGCIAIVFVMLLLVKWQDAATSIYFSDGDTVLKISGDNGATIYRSH